MNARTSLAIPAYGEQIEGGAFHGIVLLGGQIWGEVTAPKSLELKGPWHTKYSEIKNCSHDFDGLANTKAMAKGGSKLAKQFLEISHEGFTDWYLPARGGQLLQWANLKPLLSESEVFEDAWYWSSTQFSRDFAYFQLFSYGYTDYYDKSWEAGHARPVRRFLIE